MYILDGLIFITSCILTYLMIRFGKRDIPNERSSHHVPTSRMGGAALVLSMGIGWSFWSEMSGFSSFMIGILGFSVLGFIDDAYSLSPKLRLALQGLCACVLAWTPITYGVTTSLFWVFFPFLALWIVSFVNVFNFMDGLNGMSGLNALAFSFFLMVFFNWNPLPFGMMAALLGFLFWNVQGKIFLGDGGGYFLGSFFAAYPFYQGPIQDLQLTFYEPKNILFSFSVVFVLYGLYLFDTGITLLKRVMQKKNVMQAHKEHLYQRLQQTGWSHVSVSSLYGAAAVIQGTFLCIGVSLWMSIVCMGMLYGAYYGWIMHRSNALGDL